jgi:hypothetical protein
VLLLAGSFEPFDPERARECGADGHLPKPFESRTLLARVRELIERPAAPPAPPALASGGEPPSINDVLDELAAIAPEEGPTLAAAPPSRGDDDPMDVLLDEAAAEVAPVVGTPRSAATAPDRSGRADSAGEAPVELSRVRLDPADIDALARAVVARLSDRVIREIAWEVVPELAETIVRQRIRELERADAE